MQGCSPGVGYRWLARYRTEGAAGLGDHSSARRTAERMMEVAMKMFRYRS
jgi:hypothetical protein